MRIVAGRFRGRTLQGPDGPGVRPTSDSLRETLFNVLGSGAEGARVLDGFAGTGAVGLEALSRGASHATFVERDRRAIAVLRQNIAACRATSESRILCEAFVGLGSRHLDLGVFDLVFLDPPYEMGDADLVLAEAALLLAVDGIAVLEHSRRRTSPAEAGGLTRYRVLTAGDSALSFYALRRAG
jgi:16S rRNA (guanine966-N2)-methyltransferase